MRTVKVEVLFYFPLDEEDINTETLEDQVSEEIEEAYTDGVFPGCSHYTVTAGLAE